MTTSTPWAAAAVLAIAVSGCGGATSSVARRWITTPAADSEVATAIAELEFEVASRPADLAAHRELARLQLRAGRPGAALGHLEIVRRNRGLARTDRAAMARLLVERGGVRLALGQGDAVADLEAARAVDHAVAIPAATLRAAYFQAALAALAAGDRDRAVAMLAAAAEAGATGDGRIAGVAAAQPALADLGAAAVWSWDGGARRTSRELLDRYFERGGRDPDVLRRWLLARRWWGGAGDRPGLLELDQIAAAGVDLCSVAVTLDELGCGRSLLTMDPSAAAEVRRRAERFYWRTANPDQAGAWVRIALAAWLAGEVESWFGELSRRVDLDQMMARHAAGELPGFARATLLRAAGSLAPARAELLRAIDGAAGLSAEERAVVVAEAAMQGLSTEVVDTLVTAGPVAPGGWAVLLRDARQRGDPAREGALLDRAPPEVVTDYLRRAGDLGPALARRPAAGDLTWVADGQALARWQRATVAYHLEAGRDRVVARWQRLGGVPVLATDPPVPLGVVDPLAVSIALGLAADVAPGDLTELVRTYLREPAAADRLARDLVDGAVAIGARGPVVAALFAALGDPARALAWWDQVLASSPRHPPYLVAAAAAAVAAGDPARADVHIIAAAAASGDGGAVNATAARIYLEANAAVASLEAGRRAIQLCAPGEDLDLLTTIAGAAEAMGRDADAAAARAHRLARIAPEYRDAATQTWRGRRDRLVARPEVAALALYPADGGLARVRAAALSEAGRQDEAIAVLTVAASWNPSDVATRVALLQGLEPDSSRAQQVVAELLLIGLGAEPQASLALEALGEIFAARGQSVAATAVGAELRARQQGRSLRDWHGFRERGCR